jgi:hypothetical protein
MVSTLKLPQKMKKMLSPGLDGRNFPILPCLYHLLIPHSFRENSKKGYLNSTTGSLLLFLFPGNFGASSPVPLSLNPHHSLQRAYSFFLRSAERIAEAAFAKHVCSIGHPRGTSRQSGQYSGHRLVDDRVTSLPAPRRGVGHESSNLVLEGDPPATSP